MKNKSTPVPEKEEWKFHFRNRWNPIHAHYGNSPEDITEPIINFISSQKSQSFNEGYLKALEDVEKVTEKYKCDFNWDFEKGKAKHKSYIAIDDINKKLEELRKGK